MYDLEGIRDTPPPERLHVVGASEAAERPPPGSLADRVFSRRVELGQLIREGIPALDYLPASDGMLVRGKRHLIAAPAKTGKSIGMEAHWVDMAMAGASVAIFDRENGKAIYAQRLKDIYEARGMSDADRARVEDQLAYFEYPSLKRGDGAALAHAFDEVDVMVFDAQRMFLTDLGFKEADADDYAEFMSKVIDPLHQAGITTVILDNTGHAEKGCSRGSAAKGDLNEVMFSMAVDAEFNLSRRGRLRLKVETSRFGNHGAWTMEIGGGSFGSWETTSQQPKRDDVLIVVLAVLAKKSPLGQDKVLDGCRRAGVKIGNDEGRALLDTYVTRGLLARSAAGYEKGPK